DKIRLPQPQFPRCSDNTSVFYSLPLRLQQLMQGAAISRMDAQILVRLLVNKLAGLIGNLLAVETAKRGL
ncbi:hypothetical protein JI435_308880, partial [Parastagonospora nodorum SN15]